MRHYNMENKEPQKTKSKKYNHDSFVKTIFEKPQNTAELLTVAAKMNPSLKSFLDIVNLKTLKAIPTIAPREGLLGAADLAFEINLNNSTQHADLLVGVVLEHKSRKDTQVINQLYHYYFEVIRQKISASVPTVAIILYNGIEDWNPTDFKLYPEYPDYFKDIGVPFKLEFIDVGKHFKPEDLESIDPRVCCAILALCYVNNQESYRKDFVEALKKMQSLKFEEVIDTLNAIIVYLKENVPIDRKEIVMDTLEAYKNKGFISIAEAEEAEREEMQKKIDEANARADEAESRADKYEAILRQHGLL